MRQPGGNDRREGSPRSHAEIESAPRRAT